MTSYNIYMIVDKDVDDIVTTFSARTHKQASAQFINFLQALPPMHDTDDYILYCIGHTQQLIEAKAPELINVDSYDWHEAKKEMKDE